MISTRKKTSWLDVQPRVAGLDHALYCGELSSFRCFALWMISYMRSFKGLNMFTMVNIGYIRCREVYTLHLCEVKVRLDELSEV